MNKRGQAVASEYVMVFFVVIAAVAAVTTFVQRTFEARIHDTRNFMIDAVVNSGACDANCMAATGGTIAHEYEPYYAVDISNLQQNANDNSTATTGNPQALGAVYRRLTNEETVTNSVSYQLPANCVNSYGNCPQANEQGGP